MLLHLMNCVFCVTDLYRPALAVFRYQNVHVFIICGMWMISISLSKQIQSDLSQTISL